MDTTILYIIAIVGFTIGFIFLTKFLESKKIINATQMQLASVILGIGVEILKDIQIKDKNFVNITEIVKSSVDLAVAELEDSADVTALAQKFAEDQCVKLGLKVTDSRKIIIGQLIELVLKNKIG